METSEPISANYHRVFFEYTKNLENVLLGRICMDHDVNVSSFLAWVRADRVLEAKLQEVTQSRIMTMEKSK